MCASMMSLHVGREHGSSRWICAGAAVRLGSYGRSRRTEPGGSVQRSHGCARVARAYNDCTCAITRATDGPCVIPFYEGSSIGFHGRADTEE